MAAIETLMAKAAPIIENFNSGELSPLLAGRVGLKYYNNGCRRIRNFILTPQGPARRRAGTRFVAEVKDNTARTWLGRFEFNIEQAYVLEFGSLYIRFFSNHGVVGAPFEVVTPYTTADLLSAQGTFNLRFVQSGDVLYIVHPNYAPRKLARTAADTFTLSILTPDGGPFKDLEPDNTITVFASANIGTGITLAASSAIFETGHVGALFYLEQKDTDSVKQWESAKAVVANDVRKSDGKNYHAVANGTTGTIRPTHSRGTKYDGDAGVQWVFDDSGYGWCKITAIPSPSPTNITNCANNGAGLIRVTSTAHGLQTGYRAVVVGVTGTTEANGTWTVTRIDANNVDLQGSTFTNAYISGGSIQLLAGSLATVDIKSRIPNNAIGSTNATTRWAHGAWSDVEGWPDHITFFRERLCFARDRLVWQSVAGDFENFRDRDDGGIVTADAAITSDITSDRANKIEWLAPSDIALQVGTAGDESIISEISTTEPFGPGNVRARKQTEHGARHIPVLRVGDGVLYAQKSGRKIRYMRLAESIETKYTSGDMTVLAEHITKGGVIDAAYQQEPDSVAWYVRNDGILLGFTLNPEQDVRGWHPHRIGGYSDSAKTRFAIVEAITTIPSPVGDRDEFWVIVRRYINGSTKRYVEWGEYPIETGDDQENAFYVDSGLTLNNTVNAILTPGAGATVKGATGVTFVASTAVFVSGDVNRLIHYRYSTIDITGKVTWRRAVAKITGFINTSTVTCTILNAFPDLTPITANGWRLTVTVITGLSHLEGQVVQVCADGASHPDRTVSGGSITLQEPASKVHVGFGCPAVLQPMPLEAGAADGTAQGKTARISRCTIRFDNTLGAKYGRDEQEQLDEILTRGPNDPMDETPPLFTGDKLISWPDGYADSALITILQDKPLPCTIAALMPQITVQDSR